MGPFHYRPGKPFFDEVEQPMPTHRKCMEVFFLLRSIVAGE